ncbi:MAG TPA: hypothetical protein VFX03_09895 [Thermomicrobiales bacterium]|nr:hypothetical protein [Thermomicrobiales bacterium]
MRYLYFITIAIFVAGVAALAAGVLGYGPVWSLAGLLLLWTGLVKIVVVEIWRRIVRQPPEHAP